MRRSWLAALSVLLACKSASTSAPDAAPTPAVPSASAVVSASPAPKGVPGVVVARGLVHPLSMVADKTHLYLSDSGTKTLSRVPRDGGELEVLAKDQARAIGIALYQNDVVWLNRPEKALGEVRSVRTVNTKAFPIHVLRSGEAFIAFTASEAEVFIAEESAGNKGVITRVHGPTAVRLAEVQGSPQAIASDKTHAFVTTKSADGATKLQRISLKTGVVDAYPLPKGAGFTWLADRGSDLVGNGELGGKAGIHRIPKDGAAPALLAEARVNDANVVLAEGAIWFVDTELKVLRRIKESEAQTVLTSPTLGNAKALAMAPSVAYVATEGPAQEGDEAGANGAVVGLPF
jgi:hypothetical protein